MLFRAVHFLIKFALCAVLPLPRSSRGVFTEKGLRTRRQTRWKAVSQFIKYFLGHIRRIDLAEPAPHTPSTYCSSFGLSIRLQVIHYRPASRGNMPRHACMPLNWFWLVPLVGVRADCLNFSFWYAWRPLRLCAIIHLGSPPHRTLVWLTSPNPHPSEHFLLHRLFYLPHFRSFISCLKTSRFSERGFRLMDTQNGRLYSAIGWTTHSSASGGLISSVTGSLIFTVLKTT